MDLPTPDTVFRSLTVRAEHLTVHAEHSSEQHKLPELSYKNT